MVKRLEDILRFLEWVIVHPLFRRGVAVVVYGVVPVVLLDALLFATVPYYFIVKAGKVAEILLFIILFIAPLAIIFRVSLLRRALIYRQAMGVMMLYVALFHGVSLFDYTRLFDVTYYSITHNIVYGVMALLLTVMLGITSNRFSMRHLHRWWKRLHRFAYPLFFLVVVHASITTGEKKLILLALLFLLLKFLAYRRISYKIPGLSS